MLKCHIVPCGDDLPLLSEDKAETSLDAAFIQPQVGWTLANNTAPSSLDKHPTACVEWELTLNIISRATSATTS